MKKKGEIIKYFKMTIIEETVKLCMNCTATGHYASECKKTREELFERQMRKCGKCGDKGHNRRTCKT